MEFINTISHLLKIKYVILDLEHRDEVLEAKIDEISNEPKLWVIDILKLGQQINAYFMHIQTSHPSYKSFRTKVEEFFNRTKRISF